MDDNTTRFAQSLGLHPLIAQLLIDRGFDTIESAMAFLYPQRDSSLPASLLPNMAEATARIRAAIDAHEVILVFGDYDCDGICATTILKSYLDSVGANCNYYIPRRANGYGLSEQVVEELIGTYFPDLLITVDCGITSCAEVEYAQDLGVDVIVTDHHEPQDAIPQCIVVNAKLDQDNPLRDLCGAGVALKLVESLSGRSLPEEYLELAAMATVADVVPLVGENRLITYYGLQALAKTNRIGLRMLLKSCELEQVTAADVGFRLGPRINALGRMGDDADVVQLFVTDEDVVARRLVERVSAANQRRQALTKQITEQAMRMLADYDWLHRRVIVLWNEQWETGVIGLVAAKLCSDFCRPVILLGRSGDLYKGSARSIGAVNIFECLCHVGDLTVGFGGHKAAAGLSITADNLPRFADALNDYICAHYDDACFVPATQYDITIDRQTVSRAFYDQLRLLEPCGEGNPAPRLCIASSQCKLAPIPNTDHVKCRLNSDTDLVAFHGEYLLDGIAMGAEYQLALHASLKNFANRDYVQLSVEHSDLCTADALRDSASAFGRYLKTILFAPQDVGIRASTLDKEIDDCTGIYGTLWVAWSASSAAKLLTGLRDKGKEHLLPVKSVGVVQDNPLNTLVLAPVNTDGWQYRSSIIFLDAPLSTGYLHWVGTHAPNPELVLLSNYAYGSQIAGLHLDVADVQRTWVVLSGGRVSGRNVDDLCMRLQASGMSIADAYAHFYILFELGLIRVSKGFVLQYNQGRLVPSASRVWVTLTKLQSRL